MGGAERIFIEQAAALVERGIRCTLVFFELADALRDELPPQADIVVLGDCRYCDLLFFPKLVKLSRFLRKLRPDCVIAHQSLADYLRWALLGTGIPYFLLRYNSLFYLAHNTTQYSLLYRNCFHKIRNSFPAFIEGVPVRWRAGPIRRVMNELYALRDWLGVRAARKVFAITSQIQWEMEQLYRIRPVVWTPGSNLASGIPPRDDTAIRYLRDSYGIREGQPVILSVNRLEYRKRIDLLIDGYRLMSRIGSDPKLVIVGEGEERRALEEQVRSAGLEGSVRFAGLVSEQSLAQHFHMCDVSVAIIWGNWAFSIVEPLLYDKKLVITDEAPDLLKGVPNLFRVKPEPSAVAVGLTQALASAGADSFGEMADQLNWNGQMEKLLVHMRASSSMGAGPAP